MKIIKEILDNGLTLLLIPRTQTQKVSVHLWFNVGSKDELDGERGIAHLIEHMLFKGTDRLSEIDVATIVQKFCGSCNAFTSYDYTSYQFEFPAAHWKIALDLLADMMTNCTFKPDLLTSEMRAVIQELKLYRDDYKTVLDEELISLIFEDHPYHYPIIGYKQDLLKISSSSLINFYKKHYVPNNALLVVCGNINESDALDCVSQFFGSKKPDNLYKKNSYFFNKDLRNKSVNLYRDIEQPLLTCAFPIPGLHRQEPYFMDALAWLLGQGKGSRLYKKLVIEQAIATDVYVETAGLTDHDILFVHLTPAPDVEADILVPSLMQLCDDIVQDGFAPEELERAHNKTRMDYLMMQEHNDAIAYEVANLFLATDEKHAFERYLTYSGNLGHDAPSFIAQYIKPTTAHIGALLPLEEHDETYWQDLQRQKDEDDAAMLSCYQRLTKLEKPSYMPMVHTNLMSHPLFPAYHKKMLSNGTLAAWCHHPTMPTITIIVDFKTKYFYDPDTYQGITHFVSQMLLEGTRTHTAEQLIMLIEQSGMTIETEPGLLTITLMQQDFAQAIDLLYELLTQSLFSADAVERVRSQLVANIQEYWDEPYDFIDAYARKKVYGDHPYSKQPWGTKESIKRIDQERLKKYYQQTITPQDTIIAIVGDLQGYDIPSMLEKKLYQWQGPVVPTLEFPSVPRTNRTVVQYKNSRDQVVVCYAGLSVSRFDPSFDALSIVDQLLIGGQQGSMASKLFLVREQTGLFYSLEGSLIVDGIDQPGMSYIKTVVSPDQLSKAQPLMSEVINSVVSNMTEEEFEQARSMVLYGMEELTEFQHSIAQTILLMERLDKDSSYLEHRKQAIENLTRNDVQQLALPYVTTDSMALLCVGPVACSSN